MKIIQNFSTVHTTSSPNRKIEHIVIHYTAGTTSKSGSALNTSIFFASPETNVSADYIVDDTVDITDVVCPVTFVKAKVALEELDDGQILGIRMNDGEPVQNVPRSIKEEGHQILKLTDNEDGTYTLIVKKVESE